MSELQEQIKRDGYAEIMVFLKPEKRVRDEGRLTLDRETTKGLQAEVAKDLSQFFGRFEKSREVIVTRELRAHAKARAELDINDVQLSQPRAKSVRFFPNLGIMLGTVDEAGLNALAKDDKAVTKISPVSDAELIKPQLSTALAAEQPQGMSWGIERLGILQLWENGIDGTNVTIGHVDTGVDATHPALADAIDGFAEFDRAGEQVINAVASDSGRHGTHTAGIMVGQPFSGYTFGVAPGAKLASAMVIEGGIVASRLLGGLDWCVGQNVKIINISLGFRGYDPQFEDIIRILRQREILPVVAVGNEGPNTSRSPGNYRDVLSIGAVDNLDQVWIDSSSNRIPQPSGYIKPDILAPGADVWSTIPGGKLLSLSGTSMAAPHIAGLAALLWSARPHATMAQIEGAILRSAVRPPAITTIRGNRGVPNAVSALNYLP